MKELTKAEEQIMQILWNLEKAFVKEIIAKFPDPKPAYNTVSTIIRILEKKEFVSHEAFGKSFRYYPLVEKKEYTKSYFQNFLNNYFSSSFKQMVSFFAKEENMDIKDIEELKDFVNKQLEEQKKTDHD